MTEIPVRRPGRPDDTTRYLCAASYLDPSYATSALKEFLVEPTRPIPPSPGLDSVRVLAEAVRARVRRKVLDATLLFLMAVFVILSWDNPLLYGWIAFGLFVGGADFVTKMGSSANSGSRTVKIIGAAVVVGLVLWLISQYGSELFGGGSSGYYRTAAEYSSTTGETVRSVFAWILVFIVLAVLVGERFSTWQLLTSRFSRGAAPRPADHDLAPSMFAEDFRAELQRHQQVSRQAAGDTPLIVHRGYNPFVGSGVRRQSWSMAIPLERLPEDQRTGDKPLTTASMYAGIRAAVEDLRRDGVLSPDGRLGELKVDGAVYTPATELIHHFHTPDALAYLPAADRPPYGHLAHDEAERVRLQPKEWARYYLCFQVETWNRELVVSTYLHVAVTESTLYLEWTPCVLPPIRSQYQVVDKMRPNSPRPLFDGLLEWLKLPITVPGRLVNLFSRVRQPKREAGVLDPDRYGSLLSLRELAASANVSNYFQLLDVERYDKIIESRLLPAIARILRESGYSEARFEQQAAVVTTNNVNVIGINNAPITQTGPNSGSITTKMAPPARAKD
ncbi:hypothetical protein SAMN05421504_103792 [Amycolatopsis xylanica]|uniref:Uncharacterized protein n=1 Tax=Amycolatopsis xylanica TaxID=589385 RepID=A0A1H3EGG2_9PSEU|nr:hypothetical protein [Amycolatopsis xylanica]SDX77298.1 hypothetical protein SAMN05421504_103792 [Amycolatopsis xylanica]